MGASVHYRIAIGTNAGKKALTLRTVPAHSDPFGSTLLARQPGFSLHAVTVFEARQRDNLEKLCRYITRPAIANERGQVIYRFNRPFCDGTTHAVLDPLDFIARLARCSPPKLHDHDASPSTHHQSTVLLNQYVSTGCSSYAHLQSCYYVVFVFAGPDFTGSRKRWTLLRYPQCN